jgi:alpha/beta superfamily hydrolase
MSTPFPTELKAQFTLPGPIGDLELATTFPKENTNGKVIVICHPHPLYGGSMDNKVITTLMRSFNQLGFKTVRFNFRGVGQSIGEHDKGLGEANDLVAIIDWLAEALPDDHIWLAGFSFGAYVAYRVAGLAAMKRVVQQLILVAPPVFYPEFSQLPQPGIPSLVLQGEADEVVEPELVFQWAAKKQKPIKVQRFPETSHFFHGKLINLKNVLVQEFS